MQVAIVPKHDKVYLKFYLEIDPLFNNRLNTSSICLMQESVSLILHMCPVPFRHLFLTQASDNCDSMDQTLWLASSLT